MPPVSAETVDGNMAWRSSTTETKWNTSAEGRAISKVDAVAITVVSLAYWEVTTGGLYWKYGKAEEVTESRVGWRDCCMHNEYQGRQCYLEDLEQEFQSRTAGKLPESVSYRCCRCEWLEPNRPTEGAAKGPRHGQNLREVETGKVLIGRTSLAIAPCAKAAGSSGNT
jgi:hypothetical protein